MYEQTFPPQRSFNDRLGYAQAPYADLPAGALPRSPAMRLRIRVFFGVFLLCLLISLGTNFSRQPVYQATARVQITPMGHLALSGVPTAAQSPEDKQAFLAALEVLRSRPLIEQVIRQPQMQGFWKATDNDPVQTVQNMLSVTPLDGAPIAQLQAQATEQALVAPLINTLIEVYRAEQASAGSAAAQTQLIETRDEVKVIEAQVAEKKSSLDALKLRSHIVSGERDENQTLSRLKGLGASLNTATEREAKASGHLRSVESALAQGQRAPQASDNPTLAGVESRLSQLREEWRAQERRFTPDFMNMDPNAVALKARIADLEQQLVEERQKAQQTALADAREELAAAQAASRSLQQQISGDRQEVQSFTRQFGEFQTLQDELQGLEKMRQSARQKLLALESSETARRPRLLVVDPPATPDSASRPLYGRDAAIGLVASALLGFLAVWFVEFFSRVERPPQGPSAVVVPQPWMAFSPRQDPRLGAAATPDSLLEDNPRPMLENALPRELRADEVSALLSAATPDNLPILVCLLSGLTPEEAVALRCGHVNLASGSLQVPGEPGRIVPLAAALRDAVVQRSADGDQPLLSVKGTDRRLDQEDIKAVVMSSAYDASLEQPQTITAATLRHTYIAFLVRQGLRFSELSHLAGRLSAEAFNSLASLAPDSPRVSVDAVQKVLPALKVSRVSEKPV